MFAILSTTKLQRHSRRPFAWLSAALAPILVACAPISSHSIPTPAQKTVDVDWLLTATQEPSPPDLTTLCSRLFIELRHSFETACPETEITDVQTPEFYAINAEQTCGLIASVTPTRGSLDKLAWTRILADPYLPETWTSLRYDRFGLEGSIVVRTPSADNTERLVSSAQHALESCIRMSDNNYREYALSIRGVEDVHGRCLSPTPPHKTFSIAIRGAARTLEHRFDGFSPITLEWRGDHWQGQRTARLLGPLYDCTSSGTFGSCAKTLGFRTVSWSLRFKGKDVDTSVITEDSRPDNLPVCRVTTPFHGVFVSP